VAAAAAADLTRDGARDGDRDGDRDGGGRVGVGIDLVEVSQIAESLRLFPERFARRLFTPAEIDDCVRPAAAAPGRFAARFAAKEAAVKALGLTEGVDWRELEVVRGAGGACALVLHGEAARRAGPCRLALTISQAGDLATAVVLAERPDAVRAGGASGARPHAAPFPTASGTAPTASCSPAPAPSASRIDQTHCESNPS
jgi:holo-[acyl-carrier protein] synthase